MMCLLCPKLKCLGHFFLKDEIYKERQKLIRINREKNEILKVSSDKELFDELKEKGFIATLTKSDLEKIAKDGKEAAANKAVADKAESDTNKDQE